MSNDYRRYHALGNDFIVIDPNNTDLVLTKDAIRLICHRNYGIGSDGILYGPFFSDNRMRVRILNPDGTEAEKSGNGVRIFSRYLIDAGYVSEKRFSLETLGGTVHVEVLDDEACRFRVDMGTVTFRSTDIPVAGPVRDVVDEEFLLRDKQHRITCLSIGNPHCVILVDDISERLTRELGPLVENHPMFPRRINMQLVKILDRNNIRVEIWERGAGYTLASGTSSCAAANAAHKLGCVDDRVTIHLAGGIVEADITPDGHTFLTGTVNSIADGRFADQFRVQLHNASAQG